MTKYTAWHEHAYNGVTIYLTDAPANVRYTDPARFDIYVGSRDTVVSESGIVPDLPIGADNRQSSIRSKIIKLLEERGELPTSQISDLIGASIHTVSSSLFDGKRWFERTGERARYRGTISSVWRLRLAVQP